MKAAKGSSGSSEAPASLAGAVKSGKRTVVLEGGALLGLLILYVMWPAGSSYGYEGVEETEHFVSVSGTQVWAPINTTLHSNSILLPILDVTLAVYTEACGLCCLHSSEACI